MRKLSKDERSVVERTRIAESVARQITEAAARKGWKRSQWLREAIRRYLRES